MNRLAGATSPYLLQHAGNPVHWYPWGDDAFAEARARDVPIFLSVGYAACHWCHVMERESFEDTTTASFLNERFVSIKVDREERPDVDAIYMDAVQAMTGSGGWPMSVFLTPEGRPFYAGTYFPDLPRHGMPSFRQVLEGITDAWRSRREDVESQGSQIATIIARTIPTGAAGDVGIDELENQAFAQLSARFDRAWGGFSAAPKFPQTMVLTWLLRQHLRGRDGALEMALITLDRMADGGIHDQVGGGFARYSTDGRWHVPHFEKMLPDNALLLALYARAWLVTHEERYRSVAIRTGDFLVGTMQRAEGGFSSSQDADTAGVEGQTYVWRWDELVALVGEAVADAFGARPDGNWDGLNVLWMPDNVEVVADRHGIEATSLRAAIEDARDTLLHQRQRRAQPTIDDKVVTAWNGLAIDALAIAGRTFAIDRFVDAALAAAGFIWDAMRTADGRLARSWRGATSGPGFLDDHADLACGLLTLYETTGDVTWFERATSLAEAIDRLFRNPAGGFFLTGADADDLIVRPADLLDTAAPSGTSAAAEALVRLARYTGNAQDEEVAHEAVAPASAVARTQPTAVGHALCVLDGLKGPSVEVALVADRDAPEAQAMRDVIFRQRYLPNTVVAIADDRDVDRVPLLTGRVAVDGMPTAYVCERFSCLTPTTDPNMLAAQLSS